MIIGVGVGVPFGRRAAGEIVSLTNLVVANVDLNNTDNIDPYGCSISAANGVLTAVGTNAVSYQSTPNFNQSIAGTLNAKIYMRCTMWIDNNVALYADIRSEGNPRVSLASPPVQEWFVLSGFHTSSKTGNISYAPSNRYVSGEAAKDKVFRVKALMAISTTSLPVKYQALSDSELKALLDAKVPWFKGTANIAL